MYKFVQHCTMEIINNHPAGVKEITMDTEYKIDNSWNSIDVIASEPGDSWQKYFTVSREVDRQYLTAGEYAVRVTDNVTVDIDFRIRKGEVADLAKMVEIATKAEIMAGRLAEVLLDDENMHRLVVDKNTGKLTVVDEESWNAALAAALEWAEIYVNIGDEDGAREFRQQDLERADWYNHVISHTPGASYPVPYKKQVAQLAERKYQAFLEDGIPQVGDIVIKPAWDPRKLCTVVEVGPSSVKLEYRVHEEDYIRTYSREAYEAEYGEMHENDWVDEYGYNELARVLIVTFETRRIGARFDSIQLVSRPGVSAEDFKATALAEIVG